MLLPHQNFLGLTFPLDMFKSKCSYLSCFPRNISYIFVLIFIFVLISCRLYDTSEKCTSHSIVNQFSYYPLNYCYTNDDGVTSFKFTACNTKQYTVFSYTDHSCKSGENSTYGQFTKCAAHEHGESSLDEHTDNFESSICSTAY